MTKSLCILATAGTIALTSLTAPTPAEARHRGAAIAAGVIGLAAGAIIASAAARRSYAYEPGYAYGPVYVEEPAFIVEEPVAYPVHASPYRVYRHQRFYRYPYATSDIAHRDRDLVGAW